VWKTGWLKEQKETDNKTHRVKQFENLVVQTDSQINYHLYLTTLFYNWQYDYYSYDMVLTHGIHYRHHK
jgi:hypothetical protein